MAQFIQYLYEYENGKRVRNLGFMKVEKQMDKSIIQIYSKQIDEVKGITFSREDGSKYYAAWEEETDDSQTQLQSQLLSQQFQIQQSQPSQMQERDGMKRMRQEKQVDDREATLESFEIIEKSEQIDEYIPPSTRRFEKIQRQDLSRLPRKEWRLANNSFLMHGYYNYHHLLYIEDGEEVWIGVPGIYHEKEKRAAEAFGFPEFERLTDMELELSEEEKNTYDDFGYWCRQIAHS